MRLSHSWFAVFALLLAPAFASADDWPQWLGPNRDGVWREDGIVDKFPESGPEVRWKVPVSAGYAGPAVANGKVFIMDRVASDDTFLAMKDHRNDKDSSKERVLCLNESDGKLLWKHDYETKYEVAYPLGPRTTPLVRGGKVYTLGTMGHLFCLDEKTGKSVWSKNFVKDLKAKVPQWGFAANPLLDGDRLICLVGGEESVAVAFHKDTGEVLWKSLTAVEPGYCPPTMIETRAGRQLIIWHPEAVNALNPETGKLLWTQPFKSKAGLTAPTPVFSQGRLFVTAFYNGPLMLKLDSDKPEATVLWRGKGRGEMPNQTDGLHAIMPTPVIVGDYLYGICSYGELRCLKANTGERVWESMQATGGKKVRWGNAFLTPHKDRYFLFNEQGDLIIAKLSPEKYEEISRAHLLDPTNRLAGRLVVWSHPAYANRCVFVRNDKELLSVSLAAKK